MPYLILLVFSTINILCGADEALSDSQTQGGLQLHSPTPSDPLEILQRAHALKESGYDDMFVAEVFVRATGHPEVTPEILRLAAVGMCSLGSDENNVYRGRATEIYEQLGFHPEATYEDRFDAGAALDRLGDVSGIGDIGKLRAIRVFSYIKYLVENDQKKACQELSIPGENLADLLKTYAERADAALKRINSRSHEASEEFFGRNLAVDDLR